MIGYGHKSNNYTSGINPYNIPAVWGDQSDFLGATPFFDEGTIVKLREDWYYLYFGRDLVSPIGRTILLVQIDGL
jgi:hypothetical protein